MVVYAIVAIAVHALVAWLTGKIVALRERERIAELQRQRCRRAGLPARGPATPGYPGSETAAGYPGRHPARHARLTVSAGSPPARRRTVTAKSASSPGPQVPRGEAVLDDEPMASTALVEPAERQVPADVEPTTTKPSTATCAATRRRTAASEPGDEDHDVARQDRSVELLGLPPRRGRARQVGDQPPRTGVVGPGRCR